MGDQRVIRSFLEEHLHTQLLVLPASAYTSRPAATDAAPRCQARPSTSTSATQEALREALRTSRGRLEGWDGGLILGVVVKT